MITISGDIYLATFNKCNISPHNINQWLHEDALIVLVLSSIKYMSKCMSMSKWVNMNGSSALA